MKANETALHKLAAVIGDVDGGVNTAVSWVDRYSEWLAWGAVVLVIILVFSCFICPVLKCGLCVYNHGSRLLCCCCRGSSRYTRQHDEEC